MIYKNPGPHIQSEGPKSIFFCCCGRSADNFAEDDRDMRIIVRGGVYEVDLAEWKCHSLYWPGEAFDIMRGTWWVPMRGQWMIFGLFDLAHGVVKGFRGQRGMSTYDFDVTDSTKYEVFCTSEAAVTSEATKNAHISMHGN